MNNKSCAFGDADHRGDIDARVDILPETLQLVPGNNESTLEKIGGLVSVHFCEKHWEECKDLVLTENADILPQLEIDTQNYSSPISYKSKGSRHSLSRGELESKRQELIRKSLDALP
jgi:hypothetical protein